MLQRAALQWYIDNGVDEALGDAPIDRFAASEAAAKAMAKAKPNASVAMQDFAGQNPLERSAEAASIPQETPLLGASQAQEEAVKTANAAQSLAELQEAIAAFEGIEIKKTATKMVFADGNPEAKIMLIGDVPNADDDRHGKPFLGANGQMLDRILAAIGLSRSNEDTAKAVYLTNILNWRPPGNRTPTASEIAISLPFIERHIALIKPDLIILCGAIAAKAILGKTEGISRLRKSKHSYTTQTAELEAKLKNIPAIATYHPSYLLTTPLQKKAVWADMLTIQSFIDSSGQS